MNTGKSEYIKDQLQRFECNANVAVRHAYDEHRLLEPRCNTEIGARSFKYSAPILYNRLPSHVKCSENVNIFRKRLKTYLFVDCYDMENMYISDFYAL